MSIYEREANGRGRHLPTTFVGGCKIAGGVMDYWRSMSHYQWEQDGAPEKEVDPSHPRWSLETYKGFVVARTVAELNRLIECAYLFSTKSAYDNDKPTWAYYRYSYGRQAKALGRVYDKLKSVLSAIKTEQESEGRTPIGVSVDTPANYNRDGYYVDGYRKEEESHAADEAEVALLSFDD